jgi:spore germination protein GerM
VKRAVVAITIAAALLAVGCRKKSAAVVSADLQNKVAARSVQLFYESPAMTLVPEQRTVSLPESPAGALPLILRELAKGPVNPTALRLLPADVTVRGAYLLPEGTAIVDLGGETLTQGWGTGSHQELMALYSVVQTAVTNIPEVKRVRFLVNGSPAETLGGHVSLARSIAPPPATVAAR